MPIRSRSHELEDESINKFRAALPARWVCREKTADYGVDLEVEIFSSERAATGLTFLVQLKATDDPARDRKTTMSVDRIQYLEDLELPAIIVRYCSPNGKLYWLWDFEASSQADRVSKTATIRFANEWTDETPDYLFKHLELRRRIQLSRPNESFALDVRYDVSFGNELTASQALNELIRSLTFIQLTNDATRVPLGLTFSCDHVRITLGLGYLELSLDYSTVQTVMKTLAFAISAVFLRAGYMGRAATAANVCLSLGEVSDAVPRQLSLFACLALKEEALKASKLAILAGLHRQQDDAFIAFTTELVTSQSSSRGEVSAAIQMFYLQAIELAPTGDSKGAIFYSLGNARANNQEYAKAIMAFNLARKFRESYYNFGYFFAEIGGALFNGGRYACSAIAYKRSFDLDPTNNTKFCYADALLYSKKFEEAHAILTSIEGVEDEVLAVEVRLKGMIADWFAQGTVDICPSDADALAKFAELPRHVEETFLALLSAAFAARWSSFLWSWAIQMSAAVGSEELVADVMVCAQEAQGSEAYSLFRDRISSHAAGSEALGLLDALHIRARDLVAKRPRRPYVTRLIEGDQIAIFEKNV